MLRALVSFSLRFPGVVLALAGVVLAYGVYVATHTKFDIFPDFVPPMVVIQTESPGLTAEDVEKLVTQPVENAVNGAGFLESVRSQSIQGLSVVTMTFREGTDVFRARQMVGEVLSHLSGQLPLGVKAPTMAPLTSPTSTFIIIGLSSETRSLMDLRTAADWVLRPRLLGVPGVARVSVYGGEVRQLQIQVKPERLLAYDLTIEDVLAAGRRATGVRGAGFIETGGQRIVLQTQGQAMTAAAVGDAVLVQRDGIVLRLKDVAEVREGPEPKFGDGAIMGKQAVVCDVSSQYGSNTLEVTAETEKALEELRPVLEADGFQLHADIFKAASFINTATGSVVDALLLGGLMVSVVLIVFLSNWRSQLISLAAIGLFGLLYETLQWAGFAVSPMSAVLAGLVVAALLLVFLPNLRTAFISITAIPLSLLVAIIVLDWWGITLNTMTLGGLAIAIGEVVDDAIIDVENIFRRLRLYPERPRFQVVFDASMEVRSAVVYATFVVALVFLPVLTMSGLQGRLFGPLGLAYILAVMASLLVALTVTPALCYLLLAQGARELSEPPFLHVLQSGYRGVLRAISHVPYLIMGLALLVCIAAGVMASTFGSNFLPTFREQHVIPRIEISPDSSLPEAIQVGNLITQQLRDDPNLKDKIRIIAQRAGRAESADDTTGPYASEFDIDLLPLTAKENAQVMDEMRGVLSKIPGLVAAELKTFLTDRIDETIGGAHAPVVVKIFGNNLDMLDQKAREVQQVLSSIEGAEEVKLESVPGLTQLVIRARPDALRQFGFSPVEVLEAVQTAYQGTVVSQMYRGNQVFDVTVVLAPEARRDPEEVGKLVLRNPNGSRIALKELADIYMATGRHMINHDNARRRMAVTCGVKNTRDLSSFVADADQRIRERVVLPAGFYHKITGEDELRAKGQREILLHSSLAGFGIILLLAVVFKNLPNLLLVLVNLPFALIGGVLAVYFFGEAKLAIGSLVGFVTLFGITTRNSIMLISHYEHLVNEEGAIWGLETALRGAAERLAPILMTALVTALGLLPLAMKSGEAGREIEGPMAIVILGGLATSTILNLLVLPTLAHRYGKFVRTAAAETAHA